MLCAYVEGISWQILHTLANSGLCLALRLNLTPNGAGQKCQRLARKPARPAVGTEPYVPVSGVLRSLRCFVNRCAGVHGQVGPGGWGCL